MNLRAMISMPLVFLSIFLLYFSTKKEEGSPSIRKIATLGMYGAMAIALGIYESFLPDLFLPGMKLGLPNVIILLLMAYVGFKEALVVDIIRVLLVSLLRGTFLSMGGFMSLAGASASFLVMWLVLFLSKRKLTVYFASILGAVCHCVAQLWVGYLYIGNPAIFLYLPWMALLALGTGFLSAALVRLLSRIPQFAKKSQNIDASHKVGETEK